MDMWPKTEQWPKPVPLPYLKFIFREKKNTTCEKLKNKKFRQKGRVESHIVETSFKMIYHKFKLNMMVPKFHDWPLLQFKYTKCNR